MKRITLLVLLISVFSFMQVGHAIAGDSFAGWQRMEVLNKKYSKKNKSDGVESFILSADVKFYFSPKNGVKLQNVCTTKIRDEVIYIDGYFDDFNADTHQKSFACEGESGEIYQVEMHGTSTKSSLGLCAWLYQNGELVYEKFTGSIYFKTPKNRRSFGTSYTKNSKYRR